MDKVLNQVRRIFSDCGHSDKDFTCEEVKLKEANDKLREATVNFMTAASLLSDVLNKRQSRS